MLEADEDDDEGGGSTSTIRPAAASASVARRVLARADETRHLRKMLPII